MTDLLQGLKSSILGIRTYGLEDTAKSDEPNYRVILNVLPAAIYTTNANGRITYFNDAAAMLWGQRPELGKTEWCGSWKLHWPDGRAMAHAECPMALALKEKRAIRGIDAIAERPDGSRVRFMSYPTPLFDEDGEVVGAVNMLVDLSEHNRVGELQQFLAAIVESSDDAILSKNLDGIITSWNVGCERLFGYSPQEAVGRSVTMLIPEDRKDEEPSILARLRRGEKIDHYETVRRRKDGSLVDISLTVSPIRGPDGTIVGASKVARDITELKRAAAQQNLLLGEMRHRVKNLSAVIEALARQSTPRDEPVVDAFVDVFMGRMRALLSTGELLLGSPERNVELKQLLEKAILPFVGPAGANRIVSEGPPLILSEKTAGNLALALHELATNAIKYGALKAPQGKVHVVWSIERSGGEKRVRIDWRESGGEPIAGEPERKGFGSRVIASALASERDGATELRFEQDGLHCRFQFILTAV